MLHRIIHRARDYNAETDVEWADVSIHDDRVAGPDTSFRNCLNSHTNPQILVGAEAPDY
jgi:hypothetical protein